MDRRNILIGFWILSGIGLGGCAASGPRTAASKPLVTGQQEKLAWQIAKGSGAPSDYENYLRQYPSGAHADEARWEAVRRTDTISAYLQYLRDTPRSKHLGEIDARIASAAEKNLSLDDGYAYLAYCRGYDKKPSKAKLARQDAVRRRIEDLEWTDAKEGKDSLSAVLFLRKYPASSHVQEAKGLLLERRYEEAKKLAHPFAYRAFLRFYKKGAQADEISALLSQAGESAVRDDDAFDPKTSVKRLAAKDGLFAKQACSIVLADRIRPGTQPQASDEAREKMTALFNAEDSSPDACPLDRLTLDDGDKGGVARAVRVFLHDREVLEQIAQRWKVLKEREAIAKRSAKAADVLAQQIESDELSEGVLGGTALGGVDLGLSEKGSVTALRAQKRMEALQAAASGNIQTAEALIKSQNAQSEAARFYLLSLLKLE